MSDQLPEPTPVPRPANSDMLKKKQVCQLIGISSRTLSKWLSMGLVPKPIQFSPKVARWLRADIEAFLATKLDGRRARRSRDYRPLDPSRPLPSLFVHEEQYREAEERRNRELQAIRAAFLKLEGEVKKLRAWITAGASM